MQPKLERAERLARRLDQPLGVLSVAFLLIVLAQLLATDATMLAVLGVVGWVCWLTALRPSGWRSLLS